jgi:hypothetical protein
VKLNENLRILRRERGLTQAELAKKMKLKQYNISDYEIGRIEPNVATLIRFAEVFNVSLDFLVGRKIKEDSTYKKILNTEDGESYLTELEADKYIVQINEKMKHLDDDKKKQVCSSVNFLIDTFLKK